MKERAAPVGGCASDALSPERIACGQCGGSYDARAWRGLALVDRLEPGHVRALVTVWSDATCIEVRRCACGRTLARTRMA